MLAWWAPGCIGFFSQHLFDQQFVSECAAVADIEERKVGLGLNVVGVFDHNFLKLRDEYLAALLHARSGSLCPCLDVHSLSV